MLTRIRTTTVESSKRAFTLIELIVVIIIIGIIAAIAVPVYNATIGNSKEQTLSASAQAFDRNFLANAAFDSANSVSGDPRVSDQGTTGATQVLSKSGGAAVNAALQDFRGNPGGAVACVDTIPADQAAAGVAAGNPTANGTCTAISGDLTLRTAGSATPKTDATYVLFIKAGKYACLRLGTQENQPGTIKTGEATQTGDIKNADSFGATKFC